jgi:hypothetical protein
MSWLFPLSLRQRLARWVLGLGLRLTLSPRDHACYLAASQCARESNALSRETKYIGKVKHLLSVNRSIKQLVLDGRDRENIEAAVVHLAVALRFLEERR